MFVSYSINLFPGTSCVGKCYRMSPTPHVGIYGPFRCQRIFPTCREIYVMKEGEGDPMFHGNIITEALKLGLFIEL